MDLKQDYELYQINPILELAQSRSQSPRSPCPAELGTRGTWALGTRARVTTEKVTEGSVVKSDHFN